MKSNTFWFMPVFLGTLFLTSLVPTSAQVQEEDSELDTPPQTISDRISELDSRLNDVEDEMNSAAGLGMVLFLAGAFCALWAQNTNRNPWLWFFSGLLLHVIAVLVLLAKNSDDKRVARGESTSGAIWAIAAVILGILLFGATLLWRFAG